MSTKRQLCLLLAVATGAGLIAIGAYAAPPPSADPGDTTADVIAKFGKPQGSITRGKITTFYYERGLVNFVNDHVQSSTLMSPEEAARLRREQDEAARLRLEQIAAQQQGTAERAAHRTDAAFLASPAAARQAYWEDFRKRHPDIDVTTELSEAQSNAVAESRQQQSTDDFATLRTRVAAIRARLLQLDADYAASLANWKRNEITEERTKLMAELSAALARGPALQGDNLPIAPTNRPASAP